MWEDSSRSCPKTSTTTRPQMLEPAFGRVDIDLTGERGSKRRFSLNGDLRGDCGVREATIWICSQDLLDSTCQGAERSKAQGCAKSNARQCQTSSLSARQERSNRKVSSAFADDLRA